MYILYIQKIHIFMLNCKKNIQFEFMLIKGTHTHVNIH